MEGCRRSVEGWRSYARSVYVTQIRRPHPTAAPSNAPLPLPLCETKATNYKLHGGTSSAPPYVWPVAVDPWQLSGPGGQGGGEGGGGGSRTRTEETSPP